jgi:hypothetical protein
MPRLIVKGDLVKNFGELYPVPYVEQVLIAMQGKYITVFNISYSFLFLVPEPEVVENYDIAPLLSAVNNLNFYLMLTKTVDPLHSERATIAGRTDEAESVLAYASALGISPIPGAIHPDGNETYQIPGVGDSLDELSLLSYDSSLLVEILKYNHITGITTYGNELIEIDRSDLLDKINNRNFVEIYTATGQRIFKVSGIAEHTIEKMPEYLDINLVAFSSMLTPEELSDSPLTTITGLSTFIGDIAYERILEKNEVPNQTEISYFDSNNEVYMETPLQAINKKYYKLNTISREQILDRFKQVLDAYEPLTQTGKGKKKATDETLISTINLVRFALDEYKDKIDLIPRINAARRSFVEKTTGTSTGALFADLKKLVRNSTTALKRSPELTKRLTVNSKIIDARTVVSSGYVLPEPPDDISEDVLNFKLGRSVITTSDKTDTTDWFTDAGYELANTDESLSDSVSAGLIKLIGSDGGVFQLDITDPIYDGLNRDIYFTYEEYNISFGYVSFDYQSFLIKNSYLAKVCDVEKFIKTFSMEYLQGFFVPYKLQLYKYHPVTEDEWSDGSPNFSNPAAIEYILPLLKVDTEADAEYNPSDTYVLPHYILKDDPISFFDEYPPKITTNSSITISQYVAQRNVELALAENSGYRMMAFEFQNIDRKAILERWDERVHDRYKVSVDVTDSTKQALTGVIAQYLLAQGALNEYLLEAEAACSYNNIDGIFNDFFAESMTEKYSSLPSASPWIYAVVTYIKHLDFLTNRYDGDEGQMLLAAKETIQKISPQTGTLPLLQAFYTKMYNLYFEMYSPGSIIGTEITPASATFAPAPMWDIYTTSLIATKTFDMLTEATFIEDDRNQFLAVEQAREAALEALDAQFIDAEKEKRAEAARAAERARLAEEAAIIAAKAEYEYDNIKYKSDKSGCNYVVLVKSGYHAGTFRWVNPHFDEEFTHNYDSGYGRPSKYVVRERDNQKINGDWKCRSHSVAGVAEIAGTQVKFLGTQWSDWNDDTGGDPQTTNLRLKLVNSEPIDWDPTSD